MAAYLCAPLGWMGDFLCPEDRPSPIFSTFACVLNFAAGLWSFVVAVQGPCVSQTVTWVALGVATTIINFLFAIYIYIRFASKVQEMSASEAAYKLFLYDWGVCLYILVLVWTIVWMSMGGGYRDQNPGDRCGQQITTLTIFFVIFFLVGFFLIVLSLFTECCREPKWKAKSRARADPSTVQSAGVAPRPAGTFSSLFGFGGGSASRNPPPSQPMQPVAARPAPQPYQPQVVYAPAAPQHTTTYPPAAAPPPVNPAYRA